VQPLEEHRVEFAVLFPINWAMWLSVCQPNPLRETLNACALRGEMSPAMQISCFRSGDRFFYPWFLKQWQLLV